MNHFPARALSLILAVLLLLSAAGISFAAVLSGTRVYAEEGLPAPRLPLNPKARRRQKRARLTSFLFPPARLAAV